jgi:hypothetical protein
MRHSPGHSSTPSTYVEDVDKNVRKPLRDIVMCVTQVQKSAAGDDQLAPRSTASAPPELFLDQDQELGSRPELLG